MTPTPAYQPGLHILATFRAGQEALRDTDRCRQAFDLIIRELGLQKVGEAYHAFPGGGFTAVVALTESHLSIHTWPEHGLATFDVFLSNFMRDNSATVREVYRRVLEQLEGFELSKTELSR